MANWNTLHIFGFGDVQVITSKTSVTKAASSLTKLKAVIDNIWSTKPVGYVGTEEYHAINTFEGSFSNWQAKNVIEEGFRTQYADLDAVAIQELVDEVLA